MSNAKTVPVIDKDNKLVGYVTRQATSIGASKLTGYSMQMSCRLGTWMWVPAKQGA